MINFSSEVAANLAKKTGQEVVLILEIDWVNSGTVAYSDSEYTGAYPYLISCGSITRTDGEQNNNSLSVVLDATPSEVESAFRSLDLHLRPARLYIGFPGTPQRALLFDGLINSSVVWGEADRTLQFEILSKIEESLVGFALEDGFFPAVAPDDRDKPWPLPFGTVCHYPTQRLSTTVKGFLTEGLGAVDPTLPNRICQVEKTTCPNVTVQVFGGTQVRPDENCLGRKRNEGCVLKDLLSRQQATAKSVFNVRGGESFPQNKTIKVRIDQMVYYGKMIGNSFHVSNVVHPDANKVAPCLDPRGESFGRRFGIGDESEANKCTDHGKKSGFSPNNNPPQPCWGAWSSGTWNTWNSCGFGGGGSVQQEKLVGGSADSWKYYDSMETGRYLFMPAGTEVVLSEYDDDLVYMASLLPGTVTQVEAYRQFGNNRLLTQLPTDWYTINNVDFGAYQCVEVRLNQLPSASDQTGWGDEVYVSFVSSVGPNPVDIIEWLIENYSEYTVDAANFASVKTKLAQYPCNFVVEGRPSVMKLVGDIARQSRMGVRVYNGVVSLIYLSEEPTAVKTIGTGDIILEKFKYSYTPTEDLVTNHVIKWREQLTPMIQGEDYERSYSSRFNITKYGSSTVEEDYFTQNIFSGIYKSSTFWLIRKANTWLEVEFETGLDHLNVDIMDCVTLSIPQFPTTKIVITEKTYNTEENTISWKAWTPIRAGESEPYYWAWPSGKTSGVFPLADERELSVGDGSKKVVIPPVGHPLRVGYIEGQSQPSNSGDPFPSDFGYVSPGVTCRIPIGDEILYSTDPLMDPLARQSFQEDMGDKQNAAVGNGTSGSAGDREKKGCTFSGLNPCPPELSYPGDSGEKSPYCWYLVRSTYIHPDLIGTGCGGPCSQSNTNATVCSGQPFYVESVVNGYDYAVNAKQRHDSLAEQVACKANHGVPSPYFGCTITPYSDNAEDCIELVDKSPPGVVFEPNINGYVGDTPGLDMGDFDPGNPPIPPGITL